RGVGHLKLLRTLLAAGSIVTGAPSLAGVNSFSPTGPDGGVTYDVEYTAGGALLASTSRGIYRSTDGAANWTRVRELQAWAPGHLVVNPAIPGQVLAGSIGTVIRSADGGLTWAPVSGLPATIDFSVGVLEFAADGTLAFLAPQNGGKFYR